MSEWQEIDDTKPPEPEFFLVWSPDHPDIPFVVRRNIFINARHPATPKHLRMTHVTHWMPLPEPPEAT